MDRARAIAAAVKRHAGGLKLGLEFFCHNGRHGVLELAELGPADLPRSEAPRHPQHRRQGDPGAGADHAGGAHGPRRRRAGDAGGCQGRGAGRDQGRRGDRADQPRRRRPRVDRRRGEQPQPGRAAGRPGARKPGSTASSARARSRRRAQDSGRTASSSFPASARRTAPCGDQKRVMTPRGGDRCRRLDPGDRPAGDRRRAIPTRRCGRSPATL